MKQLKLGSSVLVLAFGLSLTGSVWAGGFHFPVGLAYAQGAIDVVNELDETWDYDQKFIWPVGLTFNPYYEFDFGLGIGVGVGPATFLFVDMDSYYYYGDSSWHDDETRFSFMVPLGADVRYTFFREGKVSPYVRVGFRYPIAGGDDIDSGTPGPFGAVGVEFWRNKAVGLGVEVGYDGSQVEVIGRDGKKDDVTYTGFTVSISAVF